MARPIEGGARASEERRDVQILAIILIILHVLPGVYWAGSTMVLAANGGIGAETVYPRQMGAATMVLVAGLILWWLFHWGEPGRREYVLAAGAVAAIAAGAVQGMIVGPARRSLIASDGADGAARARAAMGYRMSAGLLALAVACMVSAQYV